MRAHKNHLLMLILMASLLSGCLVQAGGPSAVDLSGRQVHVVTTVGMISDVVRNVGGDRVLVTGLMGPGVDPHLYKASEGDVLRLGSADVIFYSGLHLEAKMGEVLERMADRVIARAVTDNIDRSALLNPAAFQGQYDPHVWFDVTLWSQAVPVVRDTLTLADPSSTATYRANADAYLAKLSELDRYVREQASRVPPDQRVLVTAHDAFNYFGRAYGFDVRGLQGISTASEAGTGDVQGLSDFIASRRIRAIFIESSVPVRNVEAVQAAVRSRGWDVKIGGELYSDAMGSAGTVEGTYIGMVRHNIDTIVGALLGEGAGS